MQTNATLTLTRPAQAIDPATGYHTVGASTTVLEDAPCLFSQGRGRRAVNANGLAQYVKPISSVVLETFEEITIEPGDQAEITSGEAAATYTVLDAVLSQGVGGALWQMDLDILKT